MASLEKSKKAEKVLRFKNKHNMRARAERQHGGNGLIVIFNLEI